MGRNAVSFGRSRHLFKPQPLILVLCEDSKSGKEYLEDASRFFRADVKVRIAHCGKTDPKGIVEEAIRQKKTYDKVYCAIDRDRHPSFDEAVALAATQSEIIVIASFPCFEFWLLLHFGYSAKPYVEEGRNSPGACVIRDLRTYPSLANYDKGDSESVFDKLGDARLNVARQVSPRVYADAVNNGCLNPSTRMHVLIDFFETLGRPLPVNNS